MVETPAFLGPIKLAPGITAKQVVAFIIFAVCSACVVGFIPLMMPIIMADQLQVPSDMHGRVAGSIQVIQQTAALILISIFGALADRYSLNRLN